VLDPQVLQPLADPSQLRPLDHATARRIMEFVEARPPGHVLHHLVPQGGPMSGDRDASRAQAALRRHDIDPQDLDVLIWVPEAYHRHMHDADYFDLMNELLDAATDEVDARRQLARLRRIVEEDIARWQARRQAEQVGQ
jgi:hypothetical protein